MSPARKSSPALVVLGVIAISACADPAPEWRPLFNGTNLEGWIPKIRGSATGEDPRGTFQVFDGLLTVDYERYEGFDRDFGHLFFEEPFENYQLRIEYRFIGDQVAGGPDWAFKNSGVMVHAQDPASMTVEQDFPISIEAQFLGGGGEGERSTANLCTPGTHVEMDGELIERHCVSSTSQTFHGEEWVTVDLWVRDASIVHTVNGDTVLAYDRPVVGGGNVDGHDPVAKADGSQLTGGYIALQSESHPIQFRSVLIRSLPPSER